MAYCSQQDMIDRFGIDEIIQLTDIDQLGVVNDTVLNAAIDDASNEVDGYLAQYNLPLVTTPAILKRKCSDIARFYLYDDMSPDQVTQNYKTALAFLVNVSRGVISLGVNSAGSVLVADNEAVMVSSNSVFGRKNQY